MTLAVYIPTLGRVGNMLKIIPRWVEQGIPTRLIVNPYEFDSYRDLRDKKGWPVSITALPPHTYGIGATRAFCVEHAKARGLKSIIFCDDDMRPARDSDMCLLLEAAGQPDVLGIGAVRGIHDRFTSGAITRLRDEGHDVIICPGCWGYQLFALNVENTLKIGNFDPRLHSHGEDGELHRQGIAQLGIPWMSHVGVWSEQTGNRYDPGGLNTLHRKPGARDAAERECRAIVHDLWPKYTSHPDKKSRMSWAKFMDDFLPGWRAKSALHGGSL